MIYECCPEPYLDITVYLKLRCSPCVINLVHNFHILSMSTLSFDLLQATNALLLLQPDRALCPHCQVSRRKNDHTLPLRQKNSIHISMDSFEYMSFQHGCSWLQFSTWLWGEGLCLSLTNRQKDCYHLRWSRVTYCVKNMCFCKFHIFPTSVFIQVTLEITVLMSLTFFMNMVSHNINKHTYHPKV